MSNELVKIKGTKKGLIFNFNTEEAGYEEIKEALNEKFQEAKGFFANARFTISPDNSLTISQRDQIEEILAGHGLVKSELDIPETEKNRPSPSGDPTELLRADGDTVLLTRNLRSGQKVLATGHLVILGDVNPGAQIAATGSVVVMGTLRGTVHAGFQGDKSAYVVAYRMQPTQIRIADKVCRAPESRFNADYPEEALIMDSSIVVKPYQNGKRKVANL